MSEHGFTTENLLRSFPISLVGDPKMAALAEAIAALLVRQKEEIERASIYPRIGQLDEELLDILAADFKVDWWDSDYSLEEKRRTLQSSWRVHKLLGTKAAVELAASAVYPQTTVQEWFEYGGEPYHFRLNVNLPENQWTPTRHKRLMERLQYYKNLRSHLDSVVYQMPPVVLENRNLLWFVGLSLRAGVSNLGEDAVHLNGRNILDGTWDLLKRFTRGLAFHKMLVSMGAENQHNQALTWSVSESICTPNGLGLVRMQVWRYTASNLGIEETRLDGRHRLDGEWYLAASFIKGLALARVLLACRAGNLQKARGIMALRAQAHNAGGNAAGGFYRVLERGPQGARQESFAAAAGTRNQEQAKGSATLQIERRLDGLFNLDGAKQLNAGTIRSEL